MRFSGFRGGWVVSASSLNIVRLWELESTGICNCKDVKT